MRGERERRLTRGCSGSGSCEAIESSSTTKKPWVPEWMGWRVENGAVEKSAYGPSISKPSAIHRTRYVTSTRQRQALQWC